MSVVADNGLERGDDLSGLRQRRHTLSAYERVRRATASGGQLGREGQPLLIALLLGDPTLAVLFLLPIGPFRNVDGPDDRELSRLFCDVSPRRNSD
jgi:hypothetical protein